MNTKEQAIKLAAKAIENMSKKKGVFTLTFFDSTKIDVRVLNINSHIDESGYSCFLTTFTTSINDTTRYNIYEIKDIN